MSTTRANSELIFMSGAGQEHEVSEEKKQKKAGQPQTEVQAEPVATGGVGGGGGGGGGAGARVVNDGKLKTFEFENTRYCLTRDALGLNYSEKCNSVCLIARFEIPAGLTIAKNSDLRQIEGLMEAAGVTNQELEPSGETITLSCIGREDNDRGQVISVVEVDVADVRVCFGGMGRDPISVLGNHQNRVDPSVAMFLAPRQFYEGLEKFHASRD